MMSIYINQTCEIYLNNVRGGYRERNTLHARTCDILFNFKNIFSLKLYKHLDASSRNNYTLPDSSFLRARSESFFHNIILSRGNVFFSVLFCYLRETACVPCLTSLLRKHTRRSRARPVPMQKLSEDIPNAFCRSLEIGEGYAEGHYRAIVGETAGGR